MLENQINTPGDKKTINLDESSVGDKNNSWWICSFSLDKLRVETRMWQLQWHSSWATSRKTSLSANLQRNSVCHNKCTLFSCNRGVISVNLFWYYAQIRHLVLIFSVVVAHESSILHCCVIEIIIFIVCLNVAGSQTASLTADVLMACVLKQFCDCCVSDLRRKAWWMSSKWLLIVCLLFDFVVWYEKWLQRTIDFPIDLKRLSRRIKWFDMKTWCHEVM